MLLLVPVVAVDLVVFLHQIVGDYVAEDIKARLVPVVVIIAVPVFIGLVVWAIWLTNNEGRQT